MGRGKIGREMVESLLSWRHSGFWVHAGVRVEERAAAAGLGRYMARCPIVLDRLEWDRGGGGGGDSPSGV